MPPLKNSLGEELLAVHRSYLKLIKHLKDKISVKGISHITGGGIVGNTKRILPKGLKLRIEWESWQVPAIFKIIQKAGDISDEEMREVFNMGIGLVFVVSKGDEKSLMQYAHELYEKPVVIGKVTN